MSQLYTKTENASVIKNNFGVNEYGKPVFLYTLTNANGLQINITNYGATVQSLYVPDKNGNYEDIVLGYDKLEDYLETVK